VVPAQAGAGRITRDLDDPARGEPLRYRNPYISLDEAEEGAGACRCYGTVPMDGRSIPEALNAGIHVREPEPQRSFDRFEKYVRGAGPRENHPVGQAPRQEEGPGFLSQGHKRASDDLAPTGASA
jgi:hypothetical protein